MNKTFIIFLTTIAFSASQTMHCSSQEQLSTPPPYTPKKVLPCQGFEKYSTFRRSPSPDDRNQQTPSECGMSFFSSSPFETTNWSVDLQDTQTKETTVRKNLADEYDALSKQHRNIFMTLLINTLNPSARKFVTKVAGEEGDLYYDYVYESDIDPKTVLKHLQCLHAEDKAKIQDLYRKSTLTGNIGDFESELVRYYNATKKR